MGGAVGGAASGQWPSGPDDDANRWGNNKPPNRRLD